MLRKGHRHRHETASVDTQAIADQLVHLTQRRQILWYRRTLYMYKAGYGNMLIELTESMLGGWHLDMNVGGRHLWLHFTKAQVNQVHEAIRSSPFMANEAAACQAIDTACDHCPDPQVDAVHGELTYEQRQRLAGELAASQALHRLLTA